MVQELYALLLENAHVIGPRIARARSAKRPQWSQGDLAAELARRQALGFTKEQWLQRIKNWESGRSEPPEQALRPVEDILGLDRGWLLGEDPVVRWRVSPGNAESADAPSPKPLNLVAYWGMVPCSGWERPEIDGEELIQVSDRIEDTRGVVAVRVRGNSMLPLLTPGEVVSIRLSKEKLDGVVTLAKNQDGELTLKLMVHVGDDKWELRSINPEYGVASAESAEILGHAIYHEGGDPAGLRA